MSNIESSKLFLTIQVKFFILGLLIGVGSGGYAAYYHVTKSYYQVHDSNIGGFIFRKGKIYSLEELKSMYPTK